MLCAQDTQVARADANDDLARSLFEAGVAAGRQTRWSEAEELFQRSRALVEKPNTLLNLAIVQINLGRGREALATLDRLEAIATPAEHATVLERAGALRIEARSAAMTAARNELFLDVPLSAAACDLVSAATASYAEGRYGEALSGFERAEAESRRPELLYNVGLAADRLQAEARALLAFEAFVSALPDHPKARGLGPRIQTLRRLVRGEEKRPEVPSPTRAAEAAVRVEQPLPVPQARALKPPELRLPRGLLLGGVGAALAAGGTTLWWLSRNDAQDRCSEQSDLCTNPDDIRRQRRAALWTSVVLDATALGLISAGATLLWSRKHERGEARAFLGLHPTGLTVQGDWL